MTEKQPYLTLENYPEYIERYRDSVPNPVFARAAHRLAGVVYRPEISFTDETQVRAELAVARGAREALYPGPNHTTRYDQYMLLSVAQRVKELRHLRGKAAIPSKAEIANDKPAPVRLAAENVGAFWKHRKKDIINSGVEWTPEVEQQYYEALALAEDVEVYRMTDLGMHGAGFVEGARNLDDFRTVQRPKIGVPRLLHLVAQERPVSFVPMGFCYDLDQANYQPKDQPVAHAKSPNVHIGHPVFIRPDYTPEDIIEQIHPAIQYCVDQAVERYTERVAA